LENEDYSYEMNDEENSYKTGEMNQEKRTDRALRPNFHGVKGRSGRKPSEYTLLMRRIIAENVEDADRAFDLYVQIMENPNEETHTRMAAADRVMDRVLGKATEHSQQERKIVIEIIRENTEQSIGPLTSLALGAGTD
jgi:hypothetical protein